MSDIVTTINGQSYTFRRMTVRERVLMCEVAYEARRQLILLDQKAGVDVSASLDALRERSGDLSLLFRYLWTLAGASAVLEKANKDAPLENMEPEDMFRLACQVCGFQLKDDAGEDEANPTQSGGSG